LNFCKFSQAKKSASKTNASVGGMTKKLAKEKLETQYLPP